MFSHQPGAVGPWVEHRGSLISEDYLVWNRFLDDVDLLPSLANSSLGRKPLNGLNCVDKRVSLEMEMSPSSERSTLLIVLLVTKK